MKTSPAFGLPNGFLSELERKFFWWEPVGAQPRSDARVVAQAMNLASFAEVLELERKLGCDGGGNGDAGPAGDLTSWCPLEVGTGSAAGIECVAWLLGPLVRGCGGGLLSSSCPDVEGCGLGESETCGWPAVMLKSRWQWYERRKLRSCHVGTRIRIRGWQRQVGRTYQLLTKMFIARLKC